MPKYAIAHPGKIGDLLYCLPTAKVFHERDGALIDIYTSQACKSAERLIRYQHYINDFIIPSEYVIGHGDQGIQPWSMPIRPGYDAVFQLGYERFPHGPLHLFTGHRAGLASVPNPTYDYPDITFYNEPYIVVAHCGHRSYPQLLDAYRDFMNRAPIKCVQIGLEADYVDGTSSENQIGLDLLETVSLIAKSKAFVGFYSGPLVLANGFPELPKLITMWPGVGEQHGLHIPITLDLVHPSADVLLNALEKFL